MILAANFKTNLTRQETGEYLGELERLVASKHLKQQLYLFPATSSLMMHKGSVVVGAQNAYPTREGAFTGEIGLVHLEEFGIETILIGHSERRHILGESQVEVARKFAYFKEQGFTIIYCIGEPLRIKESGLLPTLDYLLEQFEGIDREYDRLIVAYEPIWAIGSGRTPQLEEIELIHNELKKHIGAPILYGGSVKAANAEDILALPSVDGVLVGSASLKVEEFFAMVEIAHNLENK